MKLIVCLLGISAISFSIAARETDPLVLASQELKTQVDAFFLLKGVASDQKTVQYLGSDWLKDIWSADHQFTPAYARVIQSFEKTKAILENGFEKRESDKTNLGSLKKAATAANLYFRQQKRLYLNMFRNIHQLKRGNREDLLALKNLDLILKSNVADTLLSHDSLFAAKFNLWHLEDSRGGFNAVEYGVIPAELSDMEQKSIQDVPSQEGYQKLIQLMVARERMTNQWALNRLSGGLYDKTSYGVCSKDLYSFQDLGSGDFYQSLWVQDRAEEVSLMHSEIAEATLNSPLLKTAEMTSLMEEYFNHFPSYVYENSGADPFALNGPEEQAAKDKYWARAPLAISESIEKDWKSHSVAGVGSVTYPADLINQDLLADRIAWIAWYYRQKVLIDTLKNEAAARNISEVKADPSAAWNFAETLVRGKLAATRNLAIKRIKVQVLSVLNSTPAQIKVERRRTDRFKALLDKISVPMQRAGRATYVANQIERTVKERASAWIETGRAIHSVSAKGWDKFQLAYIPMRGQLKDRVTLISPDELSLFFTKKLYFWDELDSFWRRLGKALPLTVIPLAPVFAPQVMDGLELAQNAKRVSRVATEIKNNEIVMQALQKLFGDLANAYNEELKRVGLTPAEVNETNTPLYRILPGLAHENYENLRKKLKVAHATPSIHTAASTVKPLKLPRAFALKPSNTVALDKTQVANRNLRGFAKNLKFVHHPENNQALKPAFKPLPYSIPAMAADETAIKKPLMPKKFKKPEESAQVQDEESRQATLTLYIQALSLMNLAEIVTGHNEWVLHDSKTIRMIDTPLQMEHVLNQLSPESKIERRVTQSLLDQKMASEVIRNKMMSEQPVLAIREVNDIDAPTLADRLFAFHTPGKGLDAVGARGQVWNSVQIALRNSKGLVEEACRADSEAKDENFKNIFRGAPALRAGVLAQNENYGRFDDALKKEFRSKWEKFRDDWYDPLMSVVLWVTMVAAAVYFYPIASAGIATMVATGGFSISAFTVGAGGALEALGAAGAKGLLATLMSGTVSKIVSHLFIAQAVLWYNVNNIEYPHFAEYQLKVAQSQIVGDQLQTTDLEIVNFHEEVFARKVSTYALGGMILAPETFFLVKAGAKILGRPAANALGRMERLGGAGAENIVQEIKAKSLSDQINEHGVVKGIGKSTLEKLSALKNLGRINTFGSNVSQEKLRELLTENMTELLSDEPRLLRDLYANRAYVLNEEGMRIMSAFRKGNLISKTPGAAWKISPEVKEWIRLKSTEIGFKNTPYWKFVVAENEMEALQSGKLLVGKDAPAEIAGLVQYAYVQGLLAERDFMLQSRAEMDLLLDSGQLDAKQMLKAHLRVKSDSDWSRIEQLFKWQARRSDGLVAATFNAKWMSESPALVSIKNAFHDYHTLRNEADLIVSKSWGKSAEAYFSGNGEGGGPILEIGSGRKENASEVFFDANAFMEMPSSP